MTSASPAAPQTWVWEGVHWAGSSSGWGAPARAVQVREQEAGGFSETEHLPSKLTMFDKAVGTRLSCTPPYQIVLSPPNYA